MRHQAIEYGTDYRRAQVFLVGVKGEEKVVYTPDATFRARALVLATGSMGRRQPSLKGEGELLGKGVSYCATCDGAFYCGEEIAVVGVSSEAIEEVEILTKFAALVHWITPTNPKADDAHAQQLLSRPNIQHWGKFQVQSIQGDASGVTGVQLKPRGGNADSQILPVAGVFIYGAGSQPITDFLQDDGVVVKPDGGVWTDENMATSMPGVFAIGDICNKPQKQAVVAASDGCVAAMSIDRYINGRKSFRRDWDKK